MAENGPEQPTPPDLPDYVREPLASQSPERLETVAAYANELAAWKRHQREQDREQRRAEDAIDPDDRAALEERGVSTEPADYEAVPTSGAYITVKTTKQTSEIAYRYYYWQWREGDTWKNEYIAPVQSSS